MGIVGIEVALNEGEDWDDQLTLTMTRMQWNVVLTLLVEQGKDVSDAIDRAKEATDRGNLQAAVAGLLLLDSQEKIADVCRLITELAHPAIAREARAEVAKVQWREKMSKASNMFRDLTDDEEADFRQWARDNFQPGDRIDPMWHPVVRDECDRINIDS